MTPYDRLEVMTWFDVERSRVGDIIESLKRVGRQHALVVDGEPEAQTIRGIFSSTQIARQVGEPIDTSVRAANFADLEYALVHGGM